MMPRPIEVPETNFEEAEYFCETLDCTNPWYEQGSYFDYGDDFYVPDNADAYFHLEL